MNQHAHASAAVHFGYVGNSWNYDETTKNSVSKSNQAVMGKPLHAFGPLFFSFAQAKNVWTVSSPLLSDIPNELV